MNKFKIIYHLLIVFAISLGLSSCTEVIEIDLNESERQVVIEGAIIEGIDSAKVKITMTTSYFDTSGPTPVTDAVVALTMPDNSVINLVHVGEGMYEAGGLNVVNDADYQLRVDVGDKSYTATSHLMPTLPLDSLEYEFQEPLFGQEAGYSVFLNYQDEIGKNFYRILSSVNGVLLNKPEDLLVVDDNLNDGNYIRIPVFTVLYHPGDTVVAELQSLDPEVYEFYQTLAGVVSEDAGSPFTAAPANPETNFTGGALGIFGAYTSSRKTIILPE